MAARLKAGPRNDSVLVHRVAVRSTSDGGRTWTPPAPITVSGMDAGLAPPFDPTLVALPDGRMRLYFTSYVGSAAAPGPTAIHSAISLDGTHFDYEPGTRFSVEGRVVIDCAAALHGGVFHLIVPDLPLPSTRNRRFGNLLSDGAQLLFFGTGPGPWPITSADGVRWTAASVAVRVPGVDPCAIDLADGARLVLATSGPTEQAPAPAGGLHGR